MKKTALLLLISLIFASCSQNISLNETSFQGLKNNNLWDTGAFEATVTTNGGLILKGNNLDDALIINLNSTNQKEYLLGSNGPVKAIYNITQNAKVSIFDTSVTRVDDFEPTGFLKGDGKVVIKKYDGVTVSGTFEFNAVNRDLDSGQKYVNFKKGVFYNIPVKKV
jgi:Family of unknown function (DUF6252)